MLYLLPEAARLESVLPGLTLIRHDGERKTMKCFYHPMAALIVQGVKRSVIGKREVCYGEGQCMVIGVDMPGVFHIMEASAQKPFLSLAVSLDRHVITRIMEEMPSLAEMRETTRRSHIRCRSGSGSARCLHPFGRSAGHSFKNTRTGSSDPARNSFSSA